MPTAAPPARLLSLDVFRGLTVMGMVVVNNPGSWGHIYPPLEHAEWNGCTPTDLVFPFFLFIVGVSLAYALAGVKQRGGPQGPVLAQVLRRAAISFGGNAMAVFVGSALLSRTFGLFKLALPGGGVGGLKE